MILLLTLPAAIICYLALMVFGWRLGYVRGYELRTKHQMGYSFQSPEQVARGHGTLCALLAPVMVPALLIGKYATPTPPSLAQKLQDENARRIAQLERELGIGVGR